MAMASSSLYSLRPLHHALLPKCPSLIKHPQFCPPLEFSSLQFPSRIRASSAVALEPDSQLQESIITSKDALEVDLFACPVCYEPLIREGPPGFNLSGFKCKKCNKTYSSKNIYLDLTVLAGAKVYTKFKPDGTELFRSPLVLFLYERGWRQNFNQRCFPGPDEEFNMAQEYFKPAEGGILVDVSYGSGLFSQKFAKSGTYSRVVALDFSENMLRQSYDFIKLDDAILNFNQGFLSHQVQLMLFMLVQPCIAGHPLPMQLLKSIVYYEVVVYLRPFGQRIVRNYDYLTEEEIEDLCTSSGLINYTCKVQQSFIMFSAQKP